MSDLTTLYLDYNVNSDNNNYTNITAPKGKTATNKSVSATLPSINNGNMADLQPRDHNKQRTVSCSVRESITGIILAFILLILAISNFVFILSSLML